MEPQVVQDCAVHYMAHQQAIEDTQKRLEKLESNFEGIPQEIQFIKVNMDKVCMNMEKIMEKLDTRFVTRESFDSSNTNFSAILKEMREYNEKELSDLRSNHGSELKELKDSNKWLVRGIITTLLIACKDLILHAIGK